MYSARCTGECSVASVHLTAETLPEMQRKVCTHVDVRIGCPAGRLGQLQEQWLHPRGVQQRNAALDHLRRTVAVSGIVAALVSCICLSLSISLTFS